MVLGALAMAATAVSAQTPVTFKLDGNAVATNATYTPQPTVVIGNGDYYSSPYSGEFAATLGGTSFGSPFLIWCVDFGHESYFGDIYDATVTGLGNLTTAEDGAIRQGFSDAGATNASVQNTYDWAASFASEMNPAGWDNSTTGAATRQHDVYLQEAMWYAVTDGNYSSSDNFLSALGLSTGFENTAAPTGAGNGWALIVGNTNGGLDNGYGANEQWFLVDNPPGIPTGSPTPEPATLSLMGTGLAGVLGMGLKRRRKNKTA